jgi:hypothetical protein
VTTALGAKQEGLTIVNFLNKLMIFFKTILIQLPTLLNTFLFTDRKKTIQSLVACVMQKYRLL